MPLSYSTAIPSGVSAGDVTQTSAVLWTRAVETGRLTLEVATDPSFNHIVKTKKLAVSDPLVPVKVEVEGLNTDKQYYYRFIDKSGDVIEGSFETAARLDDRDGFHFGVVADLHGVLAPYAAIKNAADMNLDLVIKLGDTVTADVPTGVPGIFGLNDGSLTTYQQIQAAEYSAYFGVNFLADLQATTSVLAIPDDHDLLDDYSGGAPVASDPRFPAQASADFINETSYYENAMKAFSQYNAIENRTYRHTGDDRFDGAPDFYRYNTYGSDAAMIVVDGRSFRDAELAHLADVPLPFPNIPFLAAAFTPDRSLLGDHQLERLKADLLDARDKGVTWKFVVLPEAIQNFGPIIRPGDRYEGYAAERNELLKFIEQNHIENVVFLTADTHWTSVNNLTYQDFLGGPQIATSAIDINMMSAGDPGFASQAVAFAASLGIITPEQVAFYNSLPVAPDADSVPNDKDDFVEGLLNNVITALGYDPIGLDNNLAAAAGKVNATLLQGDYFAGHNLGWTELNVDENTNKLVVTTWGITPYTAAELAADPATILARTPVIVSQFEVTPTSDSIIGTACKDELKGTDDADVILGAGAGDVLKGGCGNDYLDGGKGHDVVQGGGGDDHIFGRDAHDRLNGGDGNDLIDGGRGQDRLEGGTGDDVLSGGLGKDRLTGGGGNDTFKFDEALSRSNVDLITDFSVADDTIWLDNAVFTALATTGPLAAGNFHVGATAFDADDFFVYNNETGALYYDADGSGADAQIKFATLQTGLALTSGDFLVV
jgi:phosphodiesterase/alkaline phosphatase D-like protein